MNGLFLPTPELLVKMPVEKLTKMKKEELINFVAEVRTSYAESNAATQLLCGNYMKELSGLAKPGIISTIREAREAYKSSSETAKLMTSTSSSLRSMKKADLIAYITKVKDVQTIDTSKKEPCRKCEDIKGPDDDTTCAICMEEGGSFHKLPCGHEFHSSCAIEWFRKPSSKGKCPICRATPEGEASTSSRSLLTDARESANRMELYRERMAQHRRMIQYRELLTEAQELQVRQERLMGTQRPETLTSV